MPSPKQHASRFLPQRLVILLDRFVFLARRARIRAIRRVFALVGLNIVKSADYYSTLPVLEEIEQTRERWDRPSELVGVERDLDQLEGRLLDLRGRWEDDLAARTGTWEHNQGRGFGPGYPKFDARTLFYMLREHRPSAYLEVGSGLSTYYASLAAEANVEDGAPMTMTCVEPYPYPALGTIKGIDLIEGFVQDVPLDTFTALKAGDVLFIDSSHALKIDSDVAFLFLEVLPRLAPGVLVHIHDVPFPYNTPYPSKSWLFGERWPVYWNEAMIVQAFLTFNSAFEVLLSTPLVRYHDEPFLISNFPDYVPLADELNPPSSLWLRRTD